MLKGHPKGLIVAFITNMGERFGFYTMMAILVLFLQARYDLDEKSAGYIYSVFYFMIYALALVGGIIADRTGKYKTVILSGIVLMFGGYGILAFPGSPMWITFVGLAIIAFGNGMFKGNLQALVGKMYDPPQYSHLRDSAFSVFYMGINIGALFAPAAASWITNKMLAAQGFLYQANVPALAKKVIAGDADSVGKLQGLMSEATASGAMVPSSVSEFASKYMEAFTNGYNGAFAIAAVAMVVSLLVYIFFNKMLPANQERKAKGGTAAEAPQMSRAEEKKRITALLIVFVVVIFFWMSFHQNGLTLTFFARDYTQTVIGPKMNMAFNLWGLLPSVVALYGVILLVQCVIQSFRTKFPVVKTVISLVLIGGGSFMAYEAYGSFSAENVITPQLFQQFNPLFIVFLTPVIVGFFGWMNKKGIEPSSPKKIGIGMILAACAYLILAFGSYDLPSFQSLGLVGISGEAGRVSPNLLINTYLVLTFAELFLSPMGLSFVSKVAPPRFQGLMQGGWLGATAIGNQLLFVGSSLYEKLELWQVWTVFIVLCLISATFIFWIMKKLEAATSGK